MARGAGLAVLTAVGIALWAQAGFAQTAEEFKTLKKEVETLKEGQAAIQKDLQEIKGFLQRRPSAAAPPQEATVSVDGAPFKGKKDARVTLVDFTDYQ